MSKIASVDAPSFSFLFDGKKSSDLLPQWSGKVRTRSLDSLRQQETTTWTDRTSGLEVRCVAVRYSDFPAIEWTVYLKNTSHKDTPIVENFQAMESSFPCPESDDFVLHHNVGSPADGNDYRPIETSMTANTKLHFGGAGGRPTNSDMSYFNFAWGNQGKIVVVGWPGQWAADFTRVGSRELAIRAGQEQTHFKLHPGEEVRTPLMVVMNWQGDWIKGQNQWRRWMMAHGMPKPGGKLPTPMLLASSGRAYGEMIGANEANQIMHIDRYLEEGLKLDYWWMDAGWYVQNQGWPQVGTWEVDRKRFPKGFKPISDHGHAKGVKTLVWFEPERVAANTWISDNHPEWLLSPLSGLESRRSTQLGIPEPCVVFNRNDHAIDYNGIHWDAKSIAFHPGPKGEYSVVRFTAPKEGTYKVRGVFQGIDNLTTTDVHIFVNGKSVFDSFIQLEGLGKRVEADHTVELRNGEVCDFVVGNGNGNYAYDSTGLQATLTGPDGIAHDAAKEYGARDVAWTYGYLTPGKVPNSETFRPYDQINKDAAGSNSLFNLGNPVAWKWLVEHVDKLLIDNGIDLYRQDFNIDPLSFWRGNDAPDRQGITENKHIVGYLAYWDELRKRHPNMLIDSCASGGRRNDLETMRRSVPLWRSDYAYEPIGHQCMTYGISMWLPFHGTGTVADETAPYYGGGVTPIHSYAFWSNAAPSLGSGIDIREKGIDYPKLRKLIANWRTLGSYYYGDYYPLTPCTRQDDNWIAWQFDRPEKNDGVVQAFRRPKSPDSQIRLKLRGLLPEARYRISVLEGASDRDGKEVSGKELAEVGLPVNLVEQPGAAVIRYAKVGPV